MGDMEWGKKGTHEKFEAFNDEKEGISLVEIRWQPPSMILPVVY